jgi:hypothetical protein
LPPPLVAQRLPLLLHVPPPGLFGGRATGFG